MHKFNKCIGSMGETLAAEFLINKGYNIFEKNFYCNSGEIDIIAKENGYLCFIEVKSRYSNAYGFPSEAVNYIKQKKICNVAQFYIFKHRLFNYKCRFDVVEVIFNYKDNSYNVNLIKNAFQL